MSFTAGQVMDSAAALLSDPDKIIFTYPFQLPYLRIAWDELQEALYSNSVQDVNEVTTQATISAGTKEWSAVPADLLAPLFIWERTPGGTDKDWVEMEERTPDQAEVQGPTLDVWYYEEGIIKFRGATANREIRVKYQRELVTITDETTTIPVRGSKNFLNFRTAGLIARIRGNKVRADDLDTDAGTHLGQILGTKVKEGQSEPVRPRAYGTTRRNLRRR